MRDLLNQPSTGLVICFAAYWVGVRVRQRWNVPFANPLVIATALVLILIHLTPLTPSQFRRGGDMIALFNVPATTALALQIHRQWSRFRENIWPMLAGCAVGSVVSMASVVVLCRLFGIDQALIESLKPKSVTTAIALELSAAGGGIAAITIAAVIFTGIFGVITGPVLVKLLRLGERAQIGIGMGVSAHAIGTSRALEMGEVEGAMSGIALVLSGVITSIFYALLF